jgi:sugar lactone lactonase YvrE
VALSVIFSLFVGTIAQSADKGEEARTQEERISRSTTMDTRTALEPLPVVKSFPVQSIGPRGLEYVEGYLYMTQAAGDDYIFKIDPQTGKVLQKYDWTLSDFPIGLAWDGEYFYVSDDTPDEVFEAGEGFIYKVDMDFKLVGKLPAPSFWLRDMTYDGSSLLVPTAKEDEEGRGKIFFLDPKTGSVRREFLTPHGHPSGLAWDGTYIWLSNAEFLGNRDYIYKLDTKGTVLATYPAPGPYPSGLAFDGQYLWVVDWGTETMYQLDIGFTPECPSSSIELKANELLAGQKIGAKALTDTKETQYCIFATEGTKLLAIKLDSKGNLDLHIRQGKPVELSGSAIIADYSLPSPDGNEFLIIFAPQLKSGPYFIAVENKEDSEQEFTLIATPIFDIQEIEGSAEGKVDPNAGLIPFLRQYLATRGGMLSLTQYKFDVPSGAKSVTVRLEGPADKNLNLHLRHNKPVEIVEDWVAADLTVIGPGGQKGVMLAGALLKPGRWFIAVESLAKDEKVDFKVIVEIEVGSQKIMMVLEREPRK